MSQENVIVLDNGSGSIKAGYAGNKQPQAEINTLAQTRSDDKVLQDSSSLNIRAAMRGPARPYVMNHGVVEDWDEMVLLWQQLFNVLKAQPAQQPILVTEAPFNSLAHRESMVERLFEEFDAVAVQVVQSGFLPIYATGQQTGLVIEVGDGVAQTVPIYDGRLFKHCVGKLEVGGRDLTDHLGRMLSEDIGFGASSEAHLAALQKVKEQLCHVSFDYEEELAGKARSDTRSPQKTYTLPDGKVVHAENSKLFKCPEVLFKPSLLHTVAEEARGIHTHAADAIQKCPLDCQQRLAENIILSGGSMMFPGMPGRIQQELGRLLRLSVKATLVQSPKHAAWIGGSIVASMNSSIEFMSRSEYSESGAKSIHQKQGALLTTC